MIVNPKFNDFKIGDYVIHCSGVPYVNKEFKTYDIQHINIHDIATVIEKITDPTDCTAGKIKFLNIHDSEKSDDYFIDDYYFEFIIIELEDLLKIKLVNDQTLNELIQNQILNNENV